MIAPGPIGFEDAEPLAECRGWRLRVSVDEDEDVRKRTYIAYHPFHTPRIMPVSPYVTEHEAAALFPDWCRAGMPADPEVTRRLALQGGVPVVAHVGSMMVSTWADGDALRADVFVTDIRDAHASEQDEAGTPTRSTLVLRVGDGVDLALSLPPRVATRMAAAFHGDRLGAVAEALDRVDRESVVSGATTETPTRALMDLRRALNPEAWARASAGEAA